MTNRCSETHDGTPCILEAGHAGLHRAAWVSPANERPSRRGHSLIWWIVGSIVVIWLGLGVVGCVAAIAAYG